MTSIDVFEVMHTARAIRRFKPDPVPDEIIDKILDAAIRAPSPNNLQSWRFLVVTDPEKRRGVAAVYAKAGHSVAPAFGSMLNDEAMANLDESARKIVRSAMYLWDHLHEAPVLIVACLLPSPPPWENAALAPETVKGMQALSPRMDGAGIYPAVQNMILACRALGLGTVLTNLHAIFEDEVKAVLGIPPEVTTWALLPIGYPAGNFGPVRRQPPREVVFRDRWGNGWNTER
jgi:nitroreductase